MGDLIYGFDPIAFDAIAMWDLFGTSMIYGVQLNQPYSEDSKADNQPYQT